ncbi:MAG: hypothetical protein AUK47_01020 [Deltaproteobacteria bacterium CG2_30_63_29]|nr:MAG: hypothetical protein AUK47_01020 [Deltaproteobacteria bacterium CG2_30_63_29]PJB45424.1 MAG: hypothetical protein CO108_07365 [Deltaproteobacteria bacterium CG_4_9_14_3_um_filter_63_12]
MVFALVVRRAFRSTLRPVPKQLDAEGGEHIVRQIEGLEGITDDGDVVAIYGPQRGVELWTGQSRLARGVEVTLGEAQEGGLVR